MAVEMLVMGVESLGLEVEKVAYTVACAEACLGSVACNTDFAETVEEGTVEGSNLKVGHTDKLKEEDRKGTEKESSRAMVADGSWVEVGSHGEKAGSQEEDSDTGKELVAESGDYNVPFGDYGAGREDTYMNLTSCCGCSHSGHSMIAVAAFYNHSQVGERILQPSHRRPWSLQSEGLEVAHERDPEGQGFCVTNLFLLSLIWMSQSLVHFYARVEKQCSRNGNLDRLRSRLLREGRAGQLERSRGARKSRFGKAPVLQNMEVMLLVERRAHRPPLLRTLRVKVELRLHGCD